MKRRKFLQPALGTPAAVARAEGSAKEIRVEHQKNSVLVIARERRMLEEHLLRPRAMPVRNIA